MRRTTIITPILLAFGMLACSFALAGCSSDDNIDLGEIDMTVGVGSSGLVLPVSSSDHIKLTDVLELKEGDCVQTLKADSAGTKYKKGDYQFKKSDHIKAANPKVKEVSFGSPETSYHYYTVDIKQSFIDKKDSIVKKLIPEGTDIPLIEFPEREIKAFSYSGHSDDEVLSLLHADVEDLITFDIKFSPSLKSSVKFAYIRFFLPDFIEARVVNEVPDVTFKNNVLELIRVSTAQDKHIELSFTGLKNFRRTVPGDDNLNYLVLNNEVVKLNGHIRMSMAIDPDDILEGAQPGSHRVDGYVDFGEEINVISAKGYFDPKINVDPSTINIGDGIPSFLTDDDVYIDLANPAIKLSINNNLDVRALVNAKMVAFYDDAKTDSLYMYIDGLNIHPHPTGTEGTTNTTLVICREPAADTGGIQYFVKNRDSQKKNPADLQETADIGELLHRIPKAIRFWLDVHTDTTYASTIVLYDHHDEGKTEGRGLGYVIEPSYEFVAPFELEGRSVIVYNDSVNDWSKDLEKNEIELYEGKIVVTGEIYNGTPLQLELTPTAIGKDKQPLPDVSVRVVNAGANNTLTVASNYGQTPENASMTPVTIEISRNSGGSFRKLDGLAFTAKAKAGGQSAVLNDETQSIRFTNLTVNLAGHISINLDK
jgi:hypothetical protein